MADLSVNIGELQMKNPVMTASGTFGYGEEFADFIDISRIGGIIVKGTTLHKREGNPYPRMAETPSGMLNAVGLQNKGVHYFVEHIYPQIRDIHTNMIVNVSGSAVEDYVKTAEIINDLDNIPAIELNISCPNVKQGGMAFGVSACGCSEVVKAVRNVYKKTLIVKLSPNVTDITEIEIHWLTGDVYLVESNADGVAFQEDYTGDNEDYRMRYRVSNGKLIIQPCKSRLFSNMDLPRKALTVFLPDTLTLDNITVETVSANVELMGGSVDSLTVSTTSGNITGPGDRKSVV